MEKTKKIDTRRLAIMGMLAAVSFVMVLVGRVIPDVAGFLSYDPKDAIVAISGFMLGPVSAVLITVVVSLVEMFTISGTGIYGFIMNVFSTCSFVLPAALIYKRMRTIKGALLGLLTGVVFMTGCMVLWNYLITPFYMKVPRSVVSSMLGGVFLPFNAVKGSINFGLTMLLYKPLVKVFRRVGLLSQGADKGGASGLGMVVTLVAGFALVAFLVLYLIFAGVLK